MDSAAALLTPEAMERHTVHCPMAASRHTLHSGLMKQLVVILKAAGVHPDRIKIEMRGLRASDRSRPGDVVVLDFYGPDHQLVIDDASVTYMHILPQLCPGSMHPVQCLAICCCSLQE